VWLFSEDDAYCRAGIGGLSHDADITAGPAEHVRRTRSEHRVSGDHHHPRCFALLAHCHSSLDVNYSSLPSPGVDGIRPLPLCRSILPTIAPLTPSRSTGTSSREYPAPRSRMKICLPSLAASR